jgi:hypothetical protein
MTVHLRSWAAALGGEVSGRGVICPGPGHSARDRSLSVTPSATAPNGFLVNSFAGDDPLGCLDYVRAKLGLPEFSPARSRKPFDGSHSEPACPSRDRAEPKKGVCEVPGDNDPKPKAETAAWLWGRREPVLEANPAGLYLRKRGYGGQFPATLGYLPPNGKFPPAMIAAFGFADELEPDLITPPGLVAGVHLTRLTMEGGKSPIDPIKKTLGPSVGLPIVLAPANDLLAIDITEGIETGLSVLELRGTGVWVAGTAGRMPALVENLPPYTECLHIFAERDGGERFAKEAARIAAARGIETHVKAFGAR